MNTDYLRTFLAIIERGTFSDAAKQLGVTQPAVTLQVQRLERELGTRLLNRGEGRLSLTAAGQSFAVFAGRVVKEEMSLMQDLARLEDTIAGPLHLGGSTTPGEYLVPHLLGQFCQRYPGTVPSVVIGDTQEIVQWVLDDQVRVGFIGADPRDQRLRCIPFVRDELILVVAPNHPWAALPTLQLTDLAGERVITREIGSGSLTTVTDRLRAAGVVLEASDTPAFGSSQALLTAVEAGFGPAFVSRYACRHALADGSVRQIPLADLDLTRDLYLIYLAARIDTRLLQEFVAFTEQWSPPAGLV